MREILFDTETTGFDPHDGHRVIEIGCVEMINRVVCGSDRHFHHYINPERDVPESAVKVHGLTADFLSDKPVFTEVAEAFLDYVGDDGILIAHNAEFDMRFINYELKEAGYKPLPADRFKDTLQMARQKFPGQQNSLDALCRRFEIDNSHRSLHGALLDAQILAEVYIELTGGKQSGLNLEGPTQQARTNIQKKERPYRQFKASAAEREKHAEFIKTLNNPLWQRLDS